MSYLNYLLAGGKEGLVRNVFVYRNATLGTGIALNATPTIFAATEGMLSVVNTSISTDASLNNVWVIPVYIKMNVTAAGNGTDWSVELRIDKTTRYASGGTTLPAVTTSYDNPATVTWTDRTPKGKVAFGDLTLDAASSEKLVGGGVLGVASAAALSIGNEYHFMFGGEIAGTSIYNLGTSATAATKMVKTIPMPPVWLGRKCSLNMYPLGLVTSSAPSMEIEVCTVELGHPREIA